MWMVGNWFRSDHSCLAMEQEYNQKLFPVQTPSILHGLLVGAVWREPKVFALSAWAHMGWYNYCGGFVCVLVVMYVALQCVWLYLMFFIFCCRSGRCVIGVLLSYLHAPSLVVFGFWSSSSTILLPQVFLICQSCVIFSLTISQTFLEPGHQMSQNL